MKFRTRRGLNSLFTGIGLVSMLAVMTWMNRRLMPAGYWSGGLLALLVLLLAAYNLRKRFPYLPLGTSSAWLQVHLYVGAATLPLFFQHISWRVPNGMLESALAAVFLLTWGSGLLGIYITRRLPRQLTQLGREYLAEEIPWHVAQVRQQALELAKRSRGPDRPSTIVEFYLRELFPYFERPRSLAYVAYPTSRRRRSLQARLHELGRYLSSSETVLRDRLSELVQEKDDLDFHVARQTLLRLWFFAHIGLTTMLLVLGTLHGIAALAFRGSS